MAGGDVDAVWAFIRAWQRLLKVARTIADVEGVLTLRGNIAGGAELPRYRSFAAASAKVAGIKKGP
jgi:hypothetical protein